MTEWIWLNGEIISMADARISVEDRGFQFADGVYEVIRVYNGKSFELGRHLERLKQSASGIQLSLPLEIGDLSLEITRFLSRAGLKEAMIYLQLTRGAAPRNHAIPPAIRPTLLFYARPLPSATLPGTGEGAKLMTVIDERWQRCWVKSIALLPNILAKNAALAAGADEAVFLDNQMVTECSASNIFAVVGKKLLTHPVGAKVLPGITRAILLEIAPQLGIEVDERSLHEQEACRADELLITSTIREISWVARWNDHYIGQARCGPVTKRLHEALRDRIVRETEQSSSDHSKVR